MLAGFKEFIMRGNIVELAVAVVIGTAFAAVVDTVVSSLINPLLAAAGGADVGDGLGFRIRSDNPATFLDFGAIVNALIVFLITAAVVYFIIVVPMNKIAERRARGQEPEPEPISEDLVVLQEIRDLLAGQRGAGTGRAGDPSAGPTG